MLQRDRYFELDGMDENYGSWGAMGTELAAKSWLSGGRMLVNHSTWFAHLFRTQQGFSFPYSNPGNERARTRSREIWIKNQWPKQVYPLSWLIDRFKPLRDWHTIENNPVFAEVQAAGLKFRSVAKLGLPLTGHADSERRTIREVAHLGGQRVPLRAMGLSAVNGRDGTGAGEIVPLQGQLKMSRVTAGRIVANDMIQHGDTATVAHRDGSNQPSVHQTRQSKGTMAAIESQSLTKSGEGNLSVSVFVPVACPDPASSDAVSSDLAKNSRDFSSGQVVDSEILQSSHDLASIAELRSGSESRNHRGSGPSKCLLYYTCGSHDLTLELAARNNLLRSKNGHELGCVALQRTDFGDWTVVLNREKSGATMHYQILAGLERSRADYVFLCESDVFYNKSHFDFTPPDDSKFWYNTNVWRIRYSDGHAVRTANLQQVSGICASRELLLAHYRKRVELIEANGGVFDVKRMAYEPGTRGKFGDEKIATWESEFPNLDVTGHGNTLTTPHFSVESFRNKKFAEGWTETDGQIAGWPLIYGRVQEWLRELANAE